VRKLYPINRMKEVKYINTQLFSEKNEFLGINFIDWIEYDEGVEQIGINSIYCLQHAFLKGSWVISNGILPLQLLPLNRFSRFVIQLMINLGYSRPYHLIFALLLTYRRLDNNDKILFWFFGLFSPLSNIFW